MKKIFSILAAALVAFSFTACNGNGGNEPEANGFKITVDSITATSAYVEVTPLDTNATFYWGVAEAKAIAGQPFDTIVANVQAELEYIIMMYEYLYGQTVTIEQLLDKGTSSYTYSTLDPETTYTVYALYLDAEGKPTTGKLATKTFTTPAVQVTGEVDLGELEDGGFDDWRDYDGSFSAYGVSETAEVGLTIFDEDFAGTFTEKDLDAEYSYVWTSDMGENAATIVKAELVGTADEAAQTANLAGWAVCTNGIKYKFSFTYATVEEEEEEGGDELLAPKKAKAAKKQAPVKFNKNFVVKLNK